MHNNSMVTVISLGGSIVAPASGAPASGTPGGVDEQYLSDFTALIHSLLEEDEKRSFVFVVGGGGPARAWQNAYRKICGGAASDNEADWIGIMATRLNAQLIKAVMAKYCRQDVVTDPTKAEALTGRVLVAAGWKPGFSTDYDAVLLAERYGAKMLINLSNIEKVYTADPKTDPGARPLDSVSWADFRAMTGDEWIPGKNVPFDPVASRHAEKIGLKVVCAGGKNIPNIKKILLGEDFIGTVIG
jgi:uridylate kinase